MRMIDRVIRSMQDTGLIDGMSVEDADTLATAALEAMREPSPAMMMEGYGDQFRLETQLGIAAARYRYQAMIDAALNE
jgi:hypothetical protein